MRKSIFFALCSVTLLFSLPSQSALAANDNVNQSESAAQKELVQIQIEAIKALHQKDADAINKRIDDQLAQVGQGVDRFGVIASVLSTLITVLLVLGGYIGYRNAKSEAKDIAKYTAEEWFRENGPQLSKRIDELAARFEKQFQEKFQHFSNRVDPLLTDSSLTYEVLVKKYNQANELGERSQHQEAIEAYDAILDACRHDQDLKIQSIAARALVNKGAEQGKLKEFSNAAESFREALDFYAKDNSRQFDEPVAYALNGLAFTKHLKVQAIWSQDSKKALNILESSLDDLNMAIERYPNAGATVFGNKSQVLWLLSKHAQAEDEFRRALTLKNGGGKTLYESTIKDLDDSILSEFKSMRPMIDRLWQDFTVNT